MAARLPLFRAMRTSLAGAAVVSTVTAIAYERRLALDGQESNQSSQIADYYRGRTTSALLSSLFVYTISSSPVLVALGRTTITACDTLGISFLYEAIARRTFYAHFCGGENFSQVQETMRLLRQERMGVILNYAKEEHGTGEAAFDRVVKDTCDSLDVAATLPNNFIAVKLSALADPKSIRTYTEFLRASPHARAELSPQDHEQIQNLKTRVTQIMDYSVKKQVKVLIDAEQDRYQSTIEEITLDLYRRYNKKEAVVYGTYQCYLKRALGQLEDDLKTARNEGWILGAKLVRGAYIASEPRHLIHDTKEDTDDAYNSAIELLLPTTGVETVIATHNLDSLDVALSLYPTKSPVCFSQLYGMSAPLTHALRMTLEAMPQSQATKQGGGIRIYSYVPWGTVEETMKYLLRRADENSAMIERGKAERDEILGELYKRMRQRLSI